jgi:phosphopantothenoylcysteine decarboxylase/phosphopantothenate--cysteine ligase
MLALENKRILLGVTGSIAAYKSPMLVRELIKQGARVNVIMTPSAREFVTQLTLSNLSRNPVVCEMFDETMQTSGAWHIKLVHDCDLMIIAPCSASTMGKIAHGICDNALVTLATALPEGVPLLVAPAMDSTMYAHFSTQANIGILRKNGIVIIPPDEGDLSSGLVGPGRLPDTDVLLAAIYTALGIEFRKMVAEAAGPEEDINIRIKEILSRPDKGLQEAIDEDKWNTELALTRLKSDGGMLDMAGKKVLITAGPTIEKLDDVRYISNFSSGKMGFALAEVASALGAEVVLISGPVNLKCSGKIRRIDVESADEMYDAAVEDFPGMDIAIMAAAVADYTPINPVKGKIKKQDTGDRLLIELQTTNDILATLGSIKKEGQMVIGFALESENEIANGWKKLQNKNCDLIVVNSAGKAGTGFGSDDNEITILTRTGTEEYFQPMSKQLCALKIYEAIKKLS